MQISIEFCTYFIGLGVGQSEGTINSMRCENCVIKNSKCSVPSGLKCLVFLSQRKFREGHLIIKTFKRVSGKELKLRNKRKVEVS